MSKSFQDLVEDIKEIHSKSTDLGRLRKKMLTRGWDMNSVDRALWQLGIHDRKNIYFMKRFKKVVFTAGALVGIFGLVLGTIYWENNIKNKDLPGVAGTITGLFSKGEVAGVTEEAEVLLIPEPVRSSEAGIEFNFPDAWEYKDESSVDSPGYYTWLIEPSSNKSIRAELDEIYRLSAVNGSPLADGTSLFSDPLFEQIVTVTISVFQSPEYLVEESIDEWKSEFDSSAGQSGVIYSDVQKIDVNGVAGYKYTANVQLGVIEETATEYVFVTAGSRVEVSVLPAGSGRVAEIDKIINSLTFK